MRVCIFTNFIYFIMLTCFSNYVKNITVNDIYTCGVFREINIESYIGNF